MYYLLVYRQQFHVLQWDVCNTELTVYAFWAHSSVAAVHSCCLQPLLQQCITERCPFSELELDSLVTIAFLPCDPGSDDFSLNLAVVYNIWVKTYNTYRFVTGLLYYDVFQAHPCQTLCMGQNFNDIITVHHIYIYFVFYLSIMAIWVNIHIWGQLFTLFYLQTSRQNITENFFLWDHLRVGCWLDAPGPYTH